MKELKVYANEYTKKDGTTKFIAYKVVGKNGKLLSLRLTQDCVSECKQISKVAGLFVVYAKEEDISVDKSREYPVIWLKHFEKVVEYREAMKDKTPAVVEDYI